MDPADLKPGQQIRFDCHSTIPGSAGIAEFVRHFDWDGTPMLEILDLNGYRPAAGILYHDEFVEVVR